MTTDPPIIDPAGACMCDRPAERCPTHLSDRLCLACLRRESECDCEGEVP